MFYNQQLPASNIYTTAYIFRYWQLPLDGHNEVRCHYCTKGADFISFFCTHVLKPFKVIEIYHYDIQKERCIVGRRLNWVNSRIFLWLSWAKRVTRIRLLRQDLTNLDFLHAKQMPDSERYDRKNCRSTQLPVAGKVLIPPYLSVSVCQEPSCLQ